MASLLYNIMGKKTRELLEGKAVVHQETRSFLA
jgi:hypothetical protein